VAPRSKKSWSDLSHRQQRVIIAAGTVQLGLLAAALTDMWRRPPKQVRGNRLLWTAVSFVNFIGPLAYFAFGRKR
jgi:phospholipase D-like protein